MKNKKVTDQVTFRAEDWQLKRLEELEKLSPKDLKKSAVVRAALRYYLTSKDARLPTGELLSEATGPTSQDIVAGAATPTVGVDEGAEQQPIFPSLSPEMNKKLNGFVAIGRKARLEREAAAAVKHRKQA
jgi:hypothetical protein